MLVFIAGIDTIPAELNEAATVDGANAIKRFFSITLTLLKNTFKTNVMLWTVGCSGFFMWTKIFSPMTSDREPLTPMVYISILVPFTLYFITNFSEICQLVWKTQHI